MHHLPYSQKGFTLIESLVGVTIFIIVALSVYQTFSLTMTAISVSRVKNVALALANEQFEIARNLPYDDVGVSGGIPNGKIPPTQNLTRDGKDFVVKTVIRNIDDPFDGTVGGTPNDLSPADYRLVELNISCASCRNFSPLIFTTNVGPRALESASTNGSLFIRVFDAVGQPVVGADVHVENNQTSPAIVIDDTTNNDGYLQIIDAPPGDEAYEITVSQIGYSTDKTYLTGAAENPNPTKPHATVVVQQLTQISFVIDKVSLMEVSSLTDVCSATPAIDFLMSGSKLIGINTDVLKYSTNHTTDGLGQKSIFDLEWDTYNFSLNNTGHDLAGTIPLLPVVLNPNSTQNLKFIMAPKNPNSVLITVKDASTQLPLTDVEVRLEGSGYDTTLITDRGFVRQSDWSGGSGQDYYFVGSNSYFISDGNIDINNPAGEIKLLKPFGTEYSTTGELISSSFDTGSASNFHQILWQPQDQPVDAGADSVTFQIATNDDNTTWDFLGPDGTETTRYSLVDQNINPLHNGDRYLRYKVFMQTASTTWTPSISDISFTFTSACTPPGQVFFTGLSSGEYNLTATKSGYQTQVETIDASLPWQKYEIILSP